MEISFSIENLQEIRRMRARRKVVDQIELALTLSQEGEHYDRLDKFEIHLSDQTIVCVFNKGVETTVKVGNLSSEGSGRKILSTTMTNGLLPRFIFMQGSRRGDEPDMYWEKLNQLAKKHNIVNDKFNRLGISILYETITPTREMISEIIHREWNVKIEKEDLNEIFDIIYFNNINNLIDTINIAILQLVNNIIYIGPLRKATERYYRFQNLAVDEIEPDGSNLAMYLYNLSQDKRDSLNKWISSVFEFEITVKSDGGHVELEVIENGKTNQNLVDVGFGYTQVLPILVNIWKCIYKNATIYFIVPTVLYNDRFAQFAAIPLVLSFFQNRKIFPFLSHSNLTRNSFTTSVS